MNSIQFDGKCAKGCNPSKQASLIGWTFYCNDCQTLAVENYEARKRGEYFYAYDVKPEDISTKTYEAVK